MNVLSRQLMFALVTMLIATQSAAQTPPRFYLKTLVGGNAVPIIDSSMSGNINPLHTNMVLEGSRFEAEA